VGSLRSGRKRLAQPRTRRPLSDHGQADAHQVARPASSLVTAVDSIEEGVNWGEEKGRHRRELPWPSYRGVTVIIAAKWWRCRKPISLAYSVTLRLCRAPPPCDQDRPPDAIDADPRPSTHGLAVRVANPVGGIGRRHARALASLHNRSYVRYNFPMAPHCGWPPVPGAPPNPMGLHRHDDLRVVPGAQLANRRRRRTRSGSLTDRWFTVVAWIG
jgi:hypothetical protein